MSALIQENYRGYALAVRLSKGSFCFEWCDTQGNHFSDWRHYASPQKAILAGRRYVNRTIAEMAVLDFLDDMLDGQVISAEEYFSLWDSLL
ncbi:hypothetical protein DO97_14575 [Neosynechococcus sphagnicola sy1]|uniref:Uncharacterized protein n=1 Tax=Neosynechococcus sphagnicola sy1 TaxID=1497020 RepID=A0A098TIP9_9CYAN|nr:hypothetical protein [Neosynechococcus sphagnicola]KGF71862.1 hypothetical protein DO97_14575 [Neosynechococcus sphagnicola sy1]